ncbi:uncharacterized protein [Nicotiana tomentosiformis]|uniref:uncharacterized protein n=1 Tax=Nicotiana tomentosiformis TaxID=4098 RepID=UPI00388CCB6F
MESYEELYRRRYRSPVGWLEVGEIKLYGPDLTHQAIEKVGDWVFLRISPMKGVMHFEKKEFPPELEFVHPVFHGSMLRKCIGEPSRVVPIEDIHVTEDLSHEEVSMAILDRQVRKLRIKDVASVKVLWRNKNTEEMTWEVEEEMMSKYPYLFQIEDNEDAEGTQDAMEVETAL